MTGKPSMVLIAAVLGAICLSDGRAELPERWDLDRAEAQIPRLPPAAFPELPPALLAELETRGCLIPQIEPYDPARRRDNVISGQFKQPGQTDWAVLCSIDRVSQLLVFWGGAPDQVEDLSDGGLPDRNWLQGIGGDELGFSWQIRPVDEDYVLYYFEAFGGPTPPPIDHQGIDSYFVDKASSIYYWHQGQWLDLQGAD